MKARRARLLLLALAAASCQRKAERDATPDGKTLALTHCQTCHAYVPPGELDRDTWLRQTLPVMGPKLGILGHEGVSYPSDRLDPGAAGVYPAQPALSDDEWGKILRFYEANAPAKAVEVRRERPIPPSLALFDAVPLPRSGPDPPIVTCVRIDAPNRLLWLGDAANQTLVVADSALHVLGRYPTAGTIAWIDFASPESAGDRTFFLTMMGSLYPSNRFTGSVLEGRMGGGGSLLDGFYPRAKNLERPVQIQSIDVDGDGEAERLVCGFGHLKGSFYALKADGSRIVLRDGPGALRAIVSDANGDGRPDVWALFGQAREGIVLFTNEGGGTFSARDVLTFPPHHGSSSFDLMDFDDDGDKDILYTCGDNADYSMVLKPFHGIYLYLNDGANRFEERVFFPLPGASKAVARDFDGDGDPDIAVISYFADYEREPEAGFVYLENVGALKFEPSTFPLSAAGRWLTMDAGDLDGDGDDDIVLGQCALGATPAPEALQKRWNDGPAALLLRNRRR